MLIDCGQDKTRGREPQKRNNKMKTNDSERKVARIFEDVGGYYICDDDCDVLYTGGRAYATKADALRSAASGPDAYTHATGSGTYWDGIRSIAKWREW